MSEMNSEEMVMKIAVTYENGEVFQHFGHTEQFKLYEVSGGKLLHTQVVDTNGSACGGQYPSDRRRAGQRR